VSSLELISGERRRSPIAYLSVDA